MDLVKTASNMSTWGIIAVIVFMVLVLVFYPFVLIWAMNCLFPALSIPYSFSTWLATLILNATMFRKIK